MTNFNQAIEYKLPVPAGTAPVFPMVGLMDRPTVSVDGDEARITIGNGRILIHATRTKPEDDAIGPWDVESVIDQETNEPVDYSYGELGTTPFEVLVNYTLEAVGHSKLVEHRDTEDYVIYVKDWLGIGGKERIGTTVHDVFARHINDRRPQVARFSVNYGIGEPDGEYAKRDCHEYKFIRNTQCTAPAPHDYPGKLVYTCEHWPVSMRNSRFLTASTVKSFTIPIWPGRNEPLTELALACLLTWDKTEEDLMYE